MPTRMSPEVLIPRRLAHRPPHPPPVMQVTRGREHRHRPAGCAPVIFNTWDAALQRGGGAACIGGANDGKEKAGESYRRNQRDSPYPVRAGTGRAYESRGSYRILESRWPSVRHVAANDARCRRLREKKSE